MPASSSETCWRRWIRWIRWKFCSSAAARPTSISSGILIHPTVWPQSINVTRQAHRQRPDSTGRAVLLPVTQNRPRLGTSMSLIPETTQTLFCVINRLSLRFVYLHFTRLSMVNMIFWWSFFSLYYFLFLSFISVQCLLKHLWRIGT